MGYVRTEQVSFVENWYYLMSGNTGVSIGPATHR